MNYAYDGKYLIGASVRNDADSRFGENAKAGKDTVIIISADASARHQAVVTVMEAARRAGLNQITFATQSSGNTGK